MDEKKYKEAIAQLVKTDPQAFAEMVVEYIQPNHLTADWIGMLMNTRQLKPGDQLVYKVRRGITVHTLVPGSIHLASEVTVEDRAWYQLSGVDVKVHINQWDLESGQVGTLDEIQAEMRAKIQDYYLSVVFNALSSVWNASNTPNNYVNVGGSVTDTVLRAAIDRINYRTGGVRAVLGIKKVMAPISVFSQYTPYAGNATAWGVPNPSAIEEVHRTGFVGHYYGAPILAVNQVFSDPVDMTPMLPEDKILVIGKDIGEFITYGDVKVKQWTNWEPTPPVFNIELYQQYGMIITNAEGIYVIDNVS